MIHPLCSPTSARRMLGTMSNSLTMRAMIGSRTSSSGKVSLTRTPITGRPTGRGWPASSGRSRAVVEIARAEPVEVEGHVPVAGRVHRRADLDPAGHHRGQVLGRDLDAGGVAVVAHPELAEAQSLRSPDSASATERRVPRVTGVP